VCLIDCAAVEKPTGASFTIACVTADENIEISEIRFATSIRAHGFDPQLAIPFPALPIKHFGYLIGTR
jgi:hypothetical protein